MANKNVIVVKKPGEIIHANYLGHVVKGYSTYMGTACVHDGKLVMDRRKGKITVDAVMELQTALKDIQMIFCFGENPQILDEDMMPFDILLDKASDTHAALFMDGNFQGYAVTKSSHTNEFHCKEDFLAGKLPKLYRTANAGIPGFLEEMNDPITQQDLSNSWIDRGFLTVLTSGGPAVSIFNKGNVQRADYNWGMTSQSLGYVEKTEAKPEPAKVEEKKEPTLLERLLNKKAEPVVHKPADKPPVTETKVVAPETTPVNEDDWEWVGPAPEKNVGGAVMTNKMKSAWWQAEVGYLPEAYKKSSCKVKRRKGTKIGLLAPLSSGNTAPVAVPTVPVAGTGPQPDVKDAATHIKDARPDPKTLPDKKPAPENAKDIAPVHVLNTNLPLVSPLAKTKLKNGWMADAEVVKVLGDDFQKLAHDPKKLKEFQETYATFYDGLGLPDTLWLSFDALCKLGAEDPKALAIYAFNRQNDNTVAQIKLKSILSNPANKIAAEKVAM